MWLVLPALALVQQGGSTTFGTDPTEPVTRVELAFDHIEYQRSAVRDALRARVDARLFESFVLRTEAPLVHADSGAGSSDSGIGDVRAQLGWRAFSDPLFSIFFGAGVVLDTADGEALGSGQDQVVALVSASGALPRSRSRLFETIEHFVSYDGDRDRPGVALTKLQIHLMTEWSPSVWTQTGGDFIVDWKGGEHTGMNLDFEIGRGNAAGFAYWIQPAVGVFGDDVPGVFDWSITAGVRWVF